MKKTLKLVILFLLLLILAGFGSWWWLNRPPVLPESSLTLYGNIEIRDVQLSFIEQEFIEKVLVKEGERVTPGQMLATLQSDRTRTRIREAEAVVGAREQALQRIVAGTRQQEIDRLRAEVEAAAVQTGNARRRYERIRMTTRQGASTEQALDNARSEFETSRARLRAREKALDLAKAGPRQEDIEQARSNLNASKAALDLLRIRLEDLTLTSPGSGVVQSRILEPGEMALPNKPILSLALDDPKWVRAYVSEPDLGYLAQGQPASIISDSFPGQSFAGRVGFISPVAEFTPKNVETTELRTRLVYEVRIWAEDPKNRLRLGMPVTVRINIQSSKNSPGNGSATPVRSPDQSEDAS